jgi:SAM-dependent methyltransferase
MLLAMTIDDLLEAFPSATPTAGRWSFTMGSTDAATNLNFAPESCFIELFYRGEFNYCEFVGFNYHRNEPYTLNSIAYFLPPCKVERSYVNEHRNHLLLRGVDWWALVEITPSHVAASFGAHTADQAKGLVTRFRKGLENKFPAQNITNFQVWSDDDFPISRSFDDAPWVNVATNYAESTRRGLDELVSFSRHDTKRGGRIILFHGPPGTGKTWAIRSLLSQWKAWTKPAVVIDPEALFSSSTYFLNMLRFHDEEYTRIIVIEDADEIAEKEGTRGSSLSRLLNAADGLVGASSDILILLSTNAPPALLDRALTRPGRCLASIEFAPFSAPEASRRLGRTVDQPMTLAEIYQSLGTVHQVTTGLVSASTGQYL